MEGRNKWNEKFTFQTRRSGHRRQRKRTTPTTTEKVRWRRRKGREKGNPIVSCSQHPSKWNEEIYFGVKIGWVPSYPDYPMVHFTLSLSQRDSKWKCTVWKDHQSQMNWGERRETLMPEGKARNLKVWAKDYLFLFHRSFHPPHPHPIPPHPHPISSNLLCIMSSYNQIYTSLYSNKKKIENIPPPLRPFSHFTTAQGNGRPKIISFLLPPSLPSFPSSSKDSSRVLKWWTLYR